jgi:hypothetical protein
VGPETHTSQNEICLPSTNMLYNDLVSQQLCKKRRKQ